MNTEIGSILSSQYGLVKSVLELLPAFELIEIAQHVCKLWKDISQRILLNRKRSEFFYYEFPKIIPQKKVLERIKDEFAEDFQKFIRSELYTVPSLCFILTSGDMRQIHNVEGKDVFPYDDYRALYTIFPECKSLWVSSLVGIVSPSMEIETSRFIRPSFTFLSFPSSLPGLKIHSFDLSNSKDVVIKDLVPDLTEDEVIKGLLIFNSDDILNSTLLRLITNCTERSNGNMALAGAWISMTWQCSLKDERPVAQMLGTNLSGLIFTGEGVHTKSIILSSNVKSTKDVERELSKLCPEDYPSSISSFAFMFACCGRGRSHYGQESGVESSTFRRLFPHTRLVGCFCEGEIGLNKYPGCPKVKRIEEDTTYHGYTTVFMIISINSKTYKL